MTRSKPHLYRKLHKNLLVSGTEGVRKGVPKPGAKHAWAKAKRIKTQKRRRLDQKRDKLLNELGIANTENPQQTKPRSHNIFEKEEEEGRAKRKERAERRKAEEEKYQRDRQRREEQRNKREERNRQYRKRNAKGQPLMRYRIEAMLERIIRQNAEENSDAKDCEQRERND